MQLSPAFLISKPRRLPVVALDVDAAVRGPKGLGRKIEHRARAARDRLDPDVRDAVPLLLIELVAVCMFVPDSSQIVPPARDARVGRGDRLERRGQRAGVESEPFGPTRNRRSRRCRRCPRCRSSGAAGGAGRPGASRVPPRPAAPVVPPRSRRAAATRATGRAGGPVVPPRPAAPVVPPRRCRALPAVTRRVPPEPVVPAAALPPAAPVAPPLTSAAGRAAAAAGRPPRAVTPAAPVAPAWPVPLVPRCRNRRPRDPHHHQPDAAHRNETTTRIEARRKRMHSKLL